MCICFMTVYQDIRFQVYYFVILFFWILLIAIWMGAILVNALYDMLFSSQTFYQSDYRFMVGYKFISYLIYHYSVELRNLITAAADSRPNSLVPVLCSGSVF